MNIILSIPLSLMLVAYSFGPLQRAGSRADWPEWRGPNRDGISLEKDLPTKWSPNGENLAWRAPYGGRSAPVVLGDRVFIQNSVGKGAAMQERVICFNADTGKVMWEHRFNVFSSDVPPHRTGWSSPAADPATGNVYALGVGGTLTALSNDGKVLWERFLTEEFGLWTTHGGRTVSPVVDGDLVIVSGPTEGWGDLAMRRHRFMAFDKKSGVSVWISTPGGRPYDTTYSPPVVATVNGTRLFISGGGDGSVSAMKVQTGEPVWIYTMAKRGINTGAVLKGTTVFVSHSEENLDSSEMGLLAALDATASGTLGKEQTKWSIKGFQGGFSSPVIDGDRIYQIDNGANLFAFDVNTGKQLWTLNLGTIQKASPVLADGKLYVGTENGKFFILKPGPDKCEILDEDQLGSEGAPEQIIGSAAVSRGRVFLVSDTALYCIGKKTNPNPPAQETQIAPAASSEVAHVQVVPASITIKPGESVRFRARLFDANGRFIREEQAAWSLEKLKGSIQPAGNYTASADVEAQVGTVKATVGQVTGTARVRVIPPLPWSENFESYAADSAPAHWVNSVGKYVVRDINGNKVLVKLPTPEIFKRGRAFLGPDNLSNYTVEADVLATQKRRQMGDAGIVTQRYSLVLFGNHQRLELESWQPETERTVKVPFSWKPDTWYRLKLEVQNLPDNRTRVRGKAWPASEQEPSAWLVEKVDTIPNRQGSPGIYAHALFEVFFDNIKVTPNR
ncbi:MAG TPA: PQQ-binding-like beta-propeller repeat protein [Blastocatellia bacterium]|nr:PQQ-binding-like beta-propeller repeat protein [Blastocatellia bacterium]